MPAAGLCRRISTQTRLFPRLPAHHPLGGSRPPPAAARKNQSAPALGKTHTGTAREGAGTGTSLGRRRHPLPGRKVLEAARREAQEPRRTLAGGREGGEDREQPLLWQHRGEGGELQIPTVNAEWLSFLKGPPHSRPAAQDKRDSA